MIRRLPTPKKEPAADRPPIEMETVTHRDFDLTFVGMVVFSLTLEAADLLEVTEDELVFTLAKNGEEVRVNRHQLLYRSQRLRTVTRFKAGEPIGK